MKNLLFAVSMSVTATSGLAQDSWSTNSFTGVTSGSIGGENFSCSTNSFTGVTACY